MHQFLRYSIISTLVFVFLSGMGEIAAADKKNPQNSNDSGLAKVAIIPFTDNTGTGNFEYMPGSLVGAIEKSMARNFEYIAISQKAVDEVVHSDNGKSDEKKLSVAVARELSADVVVYGSFEYDSKVEEIVIFVNIYMAMNKKHLAIEMVRNTVDSTIFSATDRVATNIVNTIRDMVEEAIAKAREHGEELEARSGKGDRLVLTKNLLLSKVKWSTRKFDYNMILDMRLDNLGKALLAVEFIYSHYLRYVFNKNLYAGVTFETYALYDLVFGPDNRLTPNANLAFGGVFGGGLPVKKFYFYLEGFGGYYVSGQQDYYFGANVGVKFLPFEIRIFPVYIGINFGYRYYNMKLYQSNITPIQAGVVLGAVF